MWALRAARICAFTAAAWVVVVVVGVAVIGVADRFAPALLIVALIPGAFAAMGVIGVLRRRYYLTMVSAILLGLVFFAPLLLGVPYFPAAVAMALATLLLTFAPDETARHRRTDAGQRAAQHG